VSQTAPGTLSIKLSNVRLAARLGYRARVLGPVAKSGGHPTPLPAPTIVTFGVAEQ
jgi:hypothetical protein